MDLILKIFNKFFDVTILNNFHHFSYPGMRMIVNISDMYSTYKLIKFVAWQLDRPAPSVT